MTLGAGFTQVLAAARTGAEWAWTDLYRDLSPVLLGYLRAQGAREPEDLTAEVFIQVVKSLGRFQGDEDEFRSWVFVIAHHKLIDDRRYRGRRPAEAAETEVLEAVAPKGGDVEDEALERMSLPAIRQALSALSPDQRDVLLLRIVAQMKIEEVAAAVGKTEAAVQALQKRGLSRIRKQISAAGSTDMSEMGVN